MDDAPLTPLTLSELCGAAAPAGVRQHVYLVTLSALVNASVAAAAAATPTGPPPPAPNPSAATEHGGPLFGGGLDDPFGDPAFEIAQMHAEEGEDGEAEKAKHIEL